MMRYLTIMFFVIVVVGCGSVWAQPTKPAHKEKTIRLLTVGNSFSGNATHYLNDLAAAAGHKLVLGHADLGGCSMERHWKCVEAT